MLQTPREIEQSSLSGTSTELEENKEKIILTKLEKKGAVENEAGASGHELTEHRPVDDIPLQRVEGGSHAHHCSSDGSISPVKCIEYASCYCCLGLGLTPGYVPGNQEL